jgi:hypothetical protein
MGFTTGVLHGLLLLLVLEKRLLLDGLHNDGVFGLSALCLLQCQKIIGIIAIRVEFCIKPSVRIIIFPIEIILQ